MLQAETPISNIISLNILLSYHFRCGFTIILWNVTFPEPTSKWRRTWCGKMQVILSNSSSVVSPWVQLGQSSECTSVCRAEQLGQDWFSDLTWKKTATLRCSDWSLSAVMDFKIRVWSKFQPTKAGGNLHSGTNDFLNFKGKIICVPVMTQFHQLYSTQNCSFLVSSCRCWFLLITQGNLLLLLWRKDVSGGSLAERGVEVGGRVRLHLLADELS